MSEHTLNAERLFCPMPVIRTQEKIKTLTPGDLLTITCTDPGAMHDIPAWCRVHGHEVVDTSQIENQVIIQVRVC